MENLTEYSHAAASLALMVLLVAGLTAKYGIEKSKLSLESGEAPAPDYRNPAYRAYRALINGQEGLMLFTAALVAAVLAGAAPFWINLFASIFLLARLTMAYIHLKGFGKVEGGPRSMAYAVGFFMIAAIAVTALLTALF